MHACGSGMGDRPEHLLRTPVAGEGESGRPGGSGPARAFAYFAGMALRFADLPVRTKLLITLAIPVMGLVLLIGKQVDGSLKRRDVLRYINLQTRNIGRLSGLLHELQEENAAALTYLAGVQDNQARLSLQYVRTDAAADALNDPELVLEIGRAHV